MVFNNLYTSNKLYPFSDIFSSIHFEPKPYPKKGWAQHYHKYLLVASLILIMPVRMSYSQFPNQSGKDDNFVNARTSTFPV